MAAKIFRINYKSDFILTLNSDAGWMTPFCIKFWTGAPSQAFFVGWDGETYTHCSYDPSYPTKLVVQFDDHHLPIGELKYQVAYHFTVADFPNDTEDEVINPANITTEIDGHEYQVMLDFTGETAPEIQFSLPAYANEAQRIANEEARIAAEQQRIANEDARIAAEETRQRNEQQRIQQETARVNEFATLKSQSQAATRDANDAATLANQKAQLAADKAALADDAATLANQKAQLAADKAALANDAAQLANEKAALAQQKAEYAQQQGGYAKDQGDYAKNQGDYAKEQGDTALADHQRAEADHGIAVDDHTQAGNDHTRAEADHGISVDDHTQAGNDHTRAESDHGIAVDDHTQAGNDHTRAESDHGIAVDDHTQAGNDHTRAESDHTRAESDHAAVEPFVDSLGAFDISAYHATGGVLAKYADLTAALGTNGANIPEAIRKGGMSVKFVLSSDNKYVQYRLMSDTFNTTPSNWQGVDDEPTAGSQNLVKSGGVYPTSQKFESNVEFEEGYYTVNNGKAVKNQGAAGSWRYAIIPVKNGEKLKIRAYGTVAPGAPAYIICDDEYNALAYSAGGLIEEEVTVISASAKFVIVNNALGSEENPVVYYVTRFDDAITEISDFVKAKDKANTINLFRDKKVSIIGDSISTLAGYNYYPSEAGTYPSSTYDFNVSEITDTWWGKLLVDTGSSLVRNLSISGSGVTKIGVNKSLYERVQDLEGTEDYVYICLGCNDSIQNVPMGDYDYDAEIEELSESEFIPAYIKGIKYIQENHPNIKIVLGIILCYNLYKVNAIKRIARHYGLLCFDSSTHHLSHPSNNAHPDVIGHAAIYKSVWESIVEPISDGNPEGANALANKIYNDVTGDNFVPVGNLTYNNGEVVYPINVKFSDDTLGTIASVTKDANDDIVRVEGEYGEYDYIIAVTRYSDGSVKNVNITIN